MKWQLDEVEVKMMICVGLCACETVNGAFLFLFCVAKW